MAKLDEKQQRLLLAVSETMAQVKPTLDTLSSDYLYADYRAKAPVRDAINAAQEAGVPFIRITEDGMDFSYPGKLREWMSAPDEVVQRLISGGPDMLTPSAPAPAAVAAKFDDAVEAVKTVTHDSASGVFTVNYFGRQFEVPSLGGSAMPWSSADPAIPQGVYDLIKKSFPMWELLEDEED